MDSVLRRVGNVVRDRHRGDALVEFVLLAPTLLLVLFGILEVARVVDTWLVVQNAAREGARAGAVAYPDNAVANAAQTAATAYLSTSGLSTRADVSGVLVKPALVTGDAVQVTAEADVKIYTPLIRTVLPATVPVKGTAAMRRQ
jgi:Flp pilus assembly protein TadG